FLESRGSAKNKELVSALNALRSQRESTDNLTGTSEVSAAPDAVGARSGLELWKDDAPEVAAALASLQNDLADLDRGHRQWVADSSHELRTPIAVLRAQIEALQDGVQPVTPKALSTLHTEVMALSRLVDDLHWLSKADVGQIKPAATPIDINGLLIEVLDSFKEKREARSIKLENLVPSDAKLPAQLDETRLRQVFTNLLQNSLRYTDPNGTLRISHAVEPGGKLKLCFEDSEPGVPADLLPQIFDRFFRVEASRNRSQGGSGLGLAICLNNMQLLEGQIAADASPLGGLRVVLTLPLIAAAKERSDG
ncbi:MAG TPA: ATP-binding protein, partial [Chroococcales cyanobacterium]